MPVYFRNASSERAGSSAGSHETFTGALWPKYDDFFALGSGSFAVGGESKVHGRSSHLFVEGGDPQLQCAGRVAWHLQMLLSGTGTPPGHSG